MATYNDVMNFIDASVVLKKYKQHIIKCMGNLTITNLYHLCIAQSQLYSGSGLFCKEFYILPENAKLKDSYYSEYFFEYPILLYSMRTYCITNLGNLMTYKYGTFSYGDIRRTIQLYDCVKDIICDSFREICKILISTGSYIIDIENDKYKLEMHLTEFLQLNDILSKYNDTQIKLCGTISSRLDLELGELKTSQMFCSDTVKFLSEENMRQQQIIKMLTQRLDVLESNASKMDMIFL